MTTRPRRLRSCDSIPTGEEDIAIDEPELAPHEFARQEEEGRKKLKSRWEQIIEKYENMPDSKSDVVDLETGKLIVDNGHLKAVAKDVKALEAHNFLGDLLNANGHYDEDSEDELATATATTAVKPKATPKKTPKPQSKARERDATVEIPRSAQENAPPVSEPHMQPATPTTWTPMAQPQTLEHAQFLNALVQQSPLASSPHALAYHNQLHQGMRQFILQTVAEALGQPQQPLLANQATPQTTTSTPVVSSFPSHLTSISSTVGRDVTPAKDPKWYFPEFQAVPTRPDPSLAPASTRKRQRVMSAEHRGRKKTKLSPIVRVATPGTSVQEATSSDEQTSAQSDYLRESIQEEGLEQELGGMISTRQRLACLRSPNRERQLPTPQSFVHSEDNDSHQDMENTSLHEDTDTTVLPSIFTEEDLELLSLGGEETPRNSPSKYIREKSVAETEDDFVGVGDDLEETAFEKTPQDASRVLPPEVEPVSSGAKGSPTGRGASQIETVHSAAERISPVNGKADRRRTITHPRVVVSQPRISTPVIKRELVSTHQRRSPEKQSIPQVQKVPRDSTIADSEDEMDLVHAGMTPEPETPHPDKVLPSIETPGLAAKAKAALLPLDNDEPDELESAPVTPYVKREYQSPAPLSLLSIPMLKTPKSAPNPRRVDSSASKSTPKLSKTQIARLAKAEWAKQGRSPTPQRVKPRKSLPSLKKRDWRPEDDSEDELSRV